ncbi:MAG: hydrogenase maturation nickel metallochaperone HypA [Candidatus Omnitrophica bacterium]|nr:hydrogenase maturation nickel metallochaperone HypA [Candidatus Omnitrophota bacterium]
MHDLTFSKEILNALNTRAKSLEKGRKISAINAVLSPLSHVKPEGLVETFRVMAKGTEFENIVLNIKPLKLILKCRACQKDSKVDKPTIKCPACGSPDFDIIHDKEFSIESIEVHKKE